MTKRLFVSLCILCFVCFSKANDEDPFLLALKKQLNELNEIQITDSLSCGYTFPGKLTIRCSSENQLSELLLNDLSLTSFPSSISLHSPTLNTIYAQNAGLSSFGDGFSTLTELKHLALGVNIFASIPQFFSSFTNLTALGLYSNSLSTLPNKLSSLSSLQILGLGKNHFSSVPQCLFSLTDLSVLFLYSNSLSTLPSEMSSLFLLQWLEIGGNHFSSVPRFLFSLSNIAILGLESLSLSSLPSELSSLSSLQMLKLNDNPSLKASTDLFKNMKQLYLEISNTLISGLKHENIKTLVCSSSCVSSSNCSMNENCSCSSFNSDFCPNEVCSWCSKANTCFPFDEECRSCDLFYPTDCPSGCSDECGECSLIVNSSDCVSPCSWCESSDTCLNLTEKCTEESSLPITLILICAIVGFFVLVILIVVLSKILRRRQLKEDQSVTLTVFDTTEMDTIDFADLNEQQQEAQRKIKQRHQQENQLVNQLLLDQQLMRQNQIPAMKVYKG